MPIPNSFAAGSARAFGFLGSISPSDPYFNYVTMLLPGNGTNGAQNNTFLDSSTNNFTITRNGNTTQGTLSPYGSNWSNYFNGGANYLVVAAASAIDLASSDFTIECWVFPLAQTNSVDSVFGYGAFGTMLYRSGTTWTWEVGNGSSNYFTITANFTANTWQHIALTRSGNIFTFWLNGVSQGTNSTSGAVGTASRGITIGHNGTAAAQYFTGYISNFRLVKGTALYTANFTPPTAPLTAITNTSLLTCQSNRFIDNSSNNFAITRNGDVSIQRFSPFNPTASYAPSVDGGSGYFDGAGDYLTSPVNAALAFGSSDFCIEFWIYTTSFSTTDGRPLGNAAAWGANAWSLHNDHVSQNEKFSFWVNNYNASAAMLVSTSSTQLNTWQHVAITRSGSTWRMFVNGVIEATQTSSVAIDNGSSDDLFIGGSGNFNEFISGYFSGLRLVKGTTVYTANFTPPTAPPTAITNTSLLLNFTNAAIIDNAEMNNLETVGNAQISTAQSKFGGGSMYFDGTGDWLQTRDPVGLGGSNFTIEFWGYNLTGTSNWGVFSIGATLGADFAGITMNGGGGLFLSMTGSSWTYSNVGSITLSSNDNQWHHYAIVRNGGSLLTFKDGVQQATVSISGSLANNAGTILFGRKSDSTVTTSGYIDDLRITKGYARYTANFTPPAAAFPTK